MKKTSRSPDRRLALAVLVALLASPVRADDAVPEGPPPPEPSAYRISDYRLPTPLTLKGARVVATAEAHELWVAKAAAFVDVLPQAPRPPNLPAGTFWRDKPRRDVPGSLWLPDTGYGQLPTMTEDYFETGLEKATGNDKAKPVVIYCLKSCWMSWNAAKRAISFGYTNIIWYPDGTDGWSDAGFELEDRKPEPR